MKYRITHADGKQEDIESIAGVGQLEDIYGAGVKVERLVEETPVEKPVEKPVEVKAKPASKTAKAKDPVVPPAEEKPAEEKPAEEKPAEEKPE